MKRDYIDFSTIPEKQAEMHARLQNWARASFNGHKRACQPMFAQYRSSEVWAQHEASMPVDRLDAMKVGRGVADLPRPHNRAIIWFYIKPVSVGQVRRQIGCTVDGLALYVTDGRQMLINRRV